MKSFPTNTQFIYSWRSYQQQVLDQLGRFLQDKHLHIVAPPGSGKTVLGLEAIIRLNKPTLILSPTLTIRDQWIDRLCQLFLKTSTVPDWISTDIRAPKFLTIITYQGLHAACADDKLETIVKGLTKAGIATFALDEAHHLKNQWWMTLNNIKKALSPTIIGLTATPPYDASYTEWQRYLDMNGEVDFEISTPKLIKASDLCPHQDFVYFSQPTPDEYQKIHQFRSNISAVFQEYSRSQLLIDAFCESRIWLNPEGNLEWIYEHVEIFTSYLIFLHHNNVEIPEIHFEILGINPKNRREKKEGMPDFLYDRLELIFNFFLFDDTYLFTKHWEHREELINKLQHRGAIENKRINLSYNSKLNRLLVASNGKLNSVVDIAQFEFDALKEDLRLVVLTDYIRDEYLAFDVSEIQDVKKIGVVSIFEQLLSRNIGTNKIAVLTGSIVILPKTAFLRFQELCDEKGIFSIFPHCKSYRNNHILIESNAAIKEYIVQITTQLFTEGEILLIVGTKALLGEGWDAPAINSLILASFVGSFVLSNQMRGRAIRVQQGKPQKTSNIWHLVCIDPTEASGGQDLDILSRRFKSFVGISETENPYIENGLDRLKTHREEYSQEVVNQLNEQTLHSANQRDTLADRWHEAIKHGSKLINEIKIPSDGIRTESYIKRKNFYLTKTIAYIITDLLMMLLMYAGQILEMFLKNLRGLKTIQDVLYFLGYVAIMGLLYFGVQTFKTLRLYIRYRDIAKDIKNIASALLEALIKQNAIKTPREQLSIFAKKDDSGAVSCYLEGSTNGEQSIFLDALSEIVDVVDNPRYLIIRKGNYWGIRKDDYHAVPNLLGANKDLATYFNKLWAQWVGKCQLVYTRTLEGRKLMLRARVQSLSAKLTGKKPERYRKWG